MTVVSYLEANKLIEDLELKTKKQVDENTRQKIVGFSGRDEELIKHFFDNPDADYPVDDTSLLSKFEQKLINLLYKNNGKNISRDQIGEVLWGINWYDKYSDWSIDTHISNLRKKINFDWKLITKRERGYMLSKSVHELLISNNEFIKESPTVKITQNYINYMNDPKNVRKTLKDLFIALDNVNLNIKNILVINSFSVDNISHLAEWIKNNSFKDTNSVFSNFNQSMVIHNQKEITNHNISNMISVFDDINDTKFKNASFDLIINDFRLNFNNLHTQNIKSMKNMFKLLTDDGTLLLSVVVDPRYESIKYGKNQKKAPINKNSPCIFEADEHLPRKCFTVPYYKLLIQKSGFKIIREFDNKEGKTWVRRLKETDKNLPTYRRYLLKKIN